MPKLNLSAAQRRLLYPGHYSARVDKTTYFPSGDPSKPNGSRNPIVNLELVTEGNSNPEVNGIRLYRTQALTSESQWSAVQFISACFGEVQGDENGEIDVDFADCVGVNVVVKVSLEDYQGRQQQRIDAFLHIDTEFHENGNPVAAASDSVLVGASA